MSLDTDQSEGEALHRVDQLVSPLREAERASGPLLVGLEHEKLLFPRGSFRPVPYEGPSGVGAVLAGFLRHGYSEFREGPGLPPIAMLHGMRTISLEPGGQLELSGSPFHTAREAHQENLDHLVELKRVVNPLGLAVVTLGYRPFVGLDDMPWMPKTRYQVMRETLVNRGSLARAMMLMTATGQVSLDWRDEGDCVRKVVASARVSPATSPGAAGCGTMSTRRAAATPTPCSTARFRTGPTWSGRSTRRCCFSAGVGTTSTRGRPSATSSSEAGRAGA